jgi:hypothetical protein
MRRLCSAAVVAGLLAGGAAAAQDLLDFPDANAREVLKRARTAVGGTDAVAHLRSLVITGISRIPASPGPNLIECDLEIRILLPDRYLRIERASFGERRTGFAGKNPLSVITEKGKTILPPESLYKPIVESERERMLQLMLGLAGYLSPKDARFARSVSGPMSTEQPQGTSDAAAQRRADVAIREAGGNPGLRPPPNTYTSAVPDAHAIQVSVRDGSQFRFTTDDRTSLPSRVTYANSSGEEVTMTFGERRMTEGLNLPYRVTTMSKGRIIDDLLIYEIAVNSGLTSGNFGR